MGKRKLVKAKKSLKHQPDRTRQSLSRVGDFLQKRITTILLAVIFCLLAVSLFRPVNKAEKALRRKIAYPFLADSYLNLAIQYYDYGYGDEAKQTLAKIDASSFLSWQIKIIPGHKDQYDQLKNSIEEKDRLLNEISQWENWIKNNPPSVKIYLKLSLLYY